MKAAVRVRGARPEDYDRIIAVVDEWWGRPVSQSLPRLFLDHFWFTSRVAEDESGLAAFLIGLISPSQPHLAYVHFAGVRPDHRRGGIARALYEHFASYARDQGCTEVRAVTAPGNAGSIRFHQGLGFSASAPVAAYNGPERPMVVLRRTLGVAVDR